MNIVKNLHYLEDNFDQNHLKIHYDVTKNFNIRIYHSISGYGFGPQFSYQILIENKKDNKIENTFIFKFKSLREIIGILCTVLKDVSVIQIIQPLYTIWYVLNIDEKKFYNAIDVFINHVDKNNIVGDRIKIIIGRIEQDLTYLTI